MADLQSLAAIDLRWVRTRLLPPAYSLRWSDGEIGSLAWDNLFTSAAVARTADAAWHIRRAGLRTVRVDDAVSGNVVAVLDLRVLAADVLRFPDGRTLTLERTRMLPSAWSFRDRYGSDLVTVAARIFPLLRGGDCRIEPAGAALPEAGLLALLAINNLIRRARQRAHSS